MTRREEEETSSRPLTFDFGDFGLGVSERARDPLQLLFEKWAFVMR